jgi:XTP/dITP diphosphohydrolase
MRFVLASGNRNKLREFRAIMSPHEVVPMPAGIALPPEGVTSFRDNAVAKVRALAAALAADAAMMAVVGPEAANGTAGGAAAPPLCLADDSGLEVEALGWAPGVVSSRYAGEEAGDADNNVKLLAQLEGYPLPRRRARFVCVTAAVPVVVAAGRRRLPEYVASGEWWGSITAAPHGDGGFGYDPVFLPEGSDLTVAELPQEVKDQASHRALAGKALLELLEREGVLDGSTHGAPPTAD